MCFNEFLIVFVVYSFDTRKKMHMFCAILKLKFNYLRVVALKLLFLKQLNWVRLGSDMVRPV